MVFTDGDGVRLPPCQQCADLRDEMAVLYEDIKELRLHLARVILGAGGEIRVTGPQWHSVDASTVVIVETDHANDSRIYRVRALKEA